MQLVALLLFGLLGRSTALCPMGRRAMENPESFNDLLKRSHPEKEVEKRQSGTLPFTTFSEDQLIDVTGEYAWVAPGPGDIRGPCPGLNALANHGYFPHNGVVSLVDGWTATEQVYGW